MEQTNAQPRSCELQNQIWKHLGHIDFPKDCLNEFIKIAAVRYEPDSPILKDFRDFADNPALQYQMVLAGHNPPKLKQEFDLLAGMTVRSYARDEQLPPLFRKYAEIVRQRLSFGRIRLPNSELETAEYEIIRKLQRHRTRLLVANLVFVLPYCGWLKNYLFRRGYFDRSTRRKLLSIWLFYPETVCRYYEIVQLLKRNIW